MQLVLPPELEELVQRQLTTGHYQTAIEVIFAGVRLLEQQALEQQAEIANRLAELKQEIKLGWDAAQRGELVDGAAAMAQVRADLRSRYSSSESQLRSFG